MQSTPTLQKDNLETVWQIWLSNSINTCRKVVDIPEQVRSNDNNIKTFENSIECEQFICSLSNNDRAVFIVDDLLGQQIIPRIHELRQVFAIYVYSTEIKINESWFKQFSKVTIHWTLE